MKRMVWVLVFAALSFRVAFAQQAPNDAPASKEDVEKLFATMHVREQMHSMIELATKQSRETVLKTLKKRHPELTQKDLDYLNDFTDQMWKQFDFDAMIDDIVPVYQRHLTKDDVAAMEAFYETPTGQKFIREQPAMTAEAMQAIQPRMEKTMTSMMDEAEKRAREASTASKPPNVDKN